MSRPNWRVGDRVQCGTPGTPDYDTGTVTLANRHEYVWVRWDVAQQSYKEDPYELTRLD